MRRWARRALPRDQEVLVLADQGVGRPRRWHAIRSQQVHPIMRVRTVAAKDRPCHDFPYQNPDGTYDPSVVLDFDYTVLMPRRMG